MNLIGSILIMKIILYNQQKIFLKLVQKIKIKVIIISICFFLRKKITYKKLNKLNYRSMIMIIKNLSSIYRLKIKNINIFLPTK